MNIPGFTAEGTLYQTKGHYQTLGCSAQFDNRRTTSSATEVSPSFITFLDPRTRCIFKCDLIFAICTAGCDAGPFFGMRLCYRQCSKGYDACVAKCPPANLPPLISPPPPPLRPRGKPCGFRYCSPDEKCCSLEGNPLIENSASQFCAPKESPCDRCALPERYRGTICPGSCPCVHLQEKCCYVSGDKPPHCIPSNTHCCATGMLGCGDVKIRNWCCPPGWCDNGNCIPPS